MKWLSISSTCYHRTLAWPCLRLLALRPFSLDIVFSEVYILLDYTVRLSLRLRTDELRLRQAVSVVTGVFTCTVHQIAPYVQYPHSRFVAGRALAVQAPTSTSASTNNKTLGETAPLSTRRPLPSGTSTQRPKALNRAYSRLCRSAM